MTTSRTLLAVALFTLAGSSLAHARAPHHDAVEWRQEQRIEHGLRSGALTRHEAYRLQRQQARIDAIEHRYRADGWFSRGERQHVAQLRREASHDIQRQMHDRESVWRH